MVYIYNEGDITYQDMNLKADFMRMNMNNKEIYAYGKPDTVEGKPTPDPPGLHAGRLLLHDGHHHLQHRVGQGEDQGRSHAGGRRLAGVGGHVKR